MGRRCLWFYSRSYSGSCLQSMMAKTEYLYCCTVHSEDSLSIHTKECTSYVLYNSLIFFYIKTLKMLLYVSILRSSSGSTYCSLLKLHVKIVNMLLYLSVMWQHVLCLCMRCFQCGGGVCRRSYSITEWNKCKFNSLTE